MFKAAPALALVLLAALQGVFASNSPITLDIGKHSDVAKVMVKSLWAEMEDDSGHESHHAGPESHLTVVEDDNSTSHVLTMAYLPIIVYLGGVSMSLIDISLEGLDLVELPSIPDLIPVKGVITIPVHAPSLSFNAGSYVAGGKLQNLPFVGTGSSSAQIALTNLNIALSYKTQGPVNFCPKANSTVFNMTLDQLSMNFKDLNPGQDSGEVINAMLSSVTDDVTKMINLLLNKPAGKNLLERLIGAVVSSQLPVTCVSRQDKQDLEGDLGSHGNFLAELTQVLAKRVPMLFGRMEDFGDLESFLELVGEFLPEIDLGNSDFTQ